MGLSACLSWIKNWSDYHSEFKRICEISELSDTQRPQLKCQYNTDVTNCTERKLLQRSFYLLSASTICTIFVHNWTVYYGFILLLQKHVRRGVNERAQQFPDFSLQPKEPSLMQGMRSK